MATGLFRLLGWLDFSNKNIGWILRYLPLQLGTRTPSYHHSNSKQYFYLKIYVSGGAAWIRTKGRLPVGNLANCWFKPLTHGSIWSLPAESNRSFNSHNVTCYRYTKAGTLFKYLTNLHLYIFLYQMIFLVNYMNHTIYELHYQKHYTFFQSG